MYFQRNECKWKNLAMLLFLNSWICPVIRISPKRKYHEYFYAILLRVRQLNQRTNATGHENLLDRGNEDNDLVKPPGLSQLLSTATCWSIKSILDSLHSPTHPPLLLVYSSLVQAARRGSGTSNDVICRGENNTVCPGIWQIIYVFLLSTGKHNTRNFCSI